MNENINTVEEDEIDISGLLRAIRGKFFLVILLTAVLGAAGWAYTKYRVTPLYQSSTKMYVLAQQSNDTLTSADFVTSSYLASDYADIIRSRTVAQKVIDSLGLSMSPDELLSKVGVSAEESTRVITVYVNDSDPEMAQKLADEVREQASEHIMKVMNIDAVNVIDTANLPYAPYNINYKKNIMYGALAGFILSCLLIALFWLKNDTIRTPEDVEKRLGVSALAFIPYNGKMKKGKH